MKNSVTVIRPGVKRITLSRTIVSKIVWNFELSLPELSVLFQNQLWLQGKSNSDPGFFKKFGSFLEELSTILKTTNFGRGLTPGTIGALALRMKIRLKDHLIPKRNLNQMLTRLEKSFYTRPYRESGILKKYLPPKKVIGLGYRDKGTAKNSALNGSPSWQEVGAYYCNLVRRYHEARESLINFKRRPGNREDAWIVLRKTGELARIRDEYNAFMSRANSGDAKAASSQGQ